MGFSEPISLILKSQKRIAFFLDTKVQTTIYSVL